MQRWKIQICKCYKNVMFLILILLTYAVMIKISFQVIEV